MPIGGGEGNDWTEHEELSPGLAIGAPPGQDCLKASGFIRFGFVCPSPEEDGHGPAQQGRRQRELATICVPMEMSCDCC